MSLRVLGEDPAYPPLSINTCLNRMNTSVSKCARRSTAITAATEGEGLLSSFRHFCVTLKDSGVKVGGDEAVERVEVGGNGEGPVRADVRIA